MNAYLTFMDCPAYLTGGGRGNGGRARCGLPAEVLYRYAVASTDGPLECAKISCPIGHWFNGPIESLSIDGRRRPTGAARPRREGAAPGRLPSGRAAAGLQSEF